ncbi:ArpU family phage packaging/lysis transcriptional regulator [Limosilactobacillus reuteri]|uniref:ArpU family phage packaging/lysis transcriptional regulator n=1 Tax=Limosilactobacillus reuteri TaxID=1598 RepID=UPI002B0609D6|nr:ArpU family phage packaging/lysis transcriptional regulator [Limosilactobacillus reuteri]
MLLKAKVIPKDELTRASKEIETFMKRDYGRIYRLSGAFIEGFPFDDKPVTRAYIAITEAIDMLPKEAQIIINDRYIEPISVYEVMDKLNVGKTKYYRLKKIACYMFAKCLEKTCIQERLNYQEIIN